MTQCLGLGPGVDFGVAVRGGEIRVPQPATDDVHVDAGLEEVHGRGVTEDVRATRRMLPVFCSKNQEVHSSYHLTPEEGSSFCVRGAPSSMENADRWFVLTKTEH